MNTPPSFQTHRHLSDFTTFGIGGQSRYLVEIRSITVLQQVLMFCKEHSFPYFILGKGSNTLFDDRGFEGVVIVNRIDFCERPEEGIFYVGAGYSFSLLGTQTARQGWSGLEFASGIPGSVGGAVYMNAGANGHETCETLVSVDFMTPEGHLVKMLKSDIEFHYRYSSFQKKKGAIVGATFQLTPSTTAREKQIEIINYRKATQPYGEKSAGCVFRNPSASCYSAGALIDQSGLKGKKIGGAEVSLLHANFLINTNQATCQNVLDLITLIKKEIKDKQGIELESEVCYIPYHSPLKHEA